VLYIGKAKNLKKRVDQYFQRRDHLVIGNLLEQADHIETIITDDEKDALHLEYNLVHHYRPPFNIRLKDDKSFPMIEMSVSETFPGIYYSRQVKTGHFYVGPIVDARKTRDLIDIVTRLFKLRICTDNTFKRRTACLYYYIDRCSAPCIDKINPEAYRQSTESAIQLLKGKKETILRELEREMARLAEETKFEEAQKVKEDIQLIRQFELESYISAVKAEKRDYDVIALHHDPRDNDSFIILFSVIEGRVKKKEFFNFDSVSTRREEILKDFLVGFYRSQNIPHEIIVRSLPAESRWLEAMFSGLAGRKIAIKMPLRGKKRKTLELVVKNLNLYVNKNKYSLVGEHLKQSLHLEHFPSSIEGFDISHFSERDRVGAAVVFEKGAPVKKKYRNYIIKQASAGDTEAMKEMLERRFKKVTEDRYPDLLLIDGGKPQLSAALEIKEKLGITSDIVALAKKEERIFLESGDSVLFPEDSPERFLLQNIRDEVHRRAVMHHRRRREKI
jgi:excinuclease ABC subunit C